MAAAVTVNDVLDGHAFRTAVHRFAADNKIPVVRFGTHDRKIEVMRPYLAGQARTGRSGVAAIGIAQELQNVFASAVIGWVRASSGCSSHLDEPAAIAADRA